MSEISIRATCLARAAQHAEAVERGREGPVGRIVAHDRGHARTGPRTRPASASPESSSGSPVETESSILVKRGRLSALCGRGLGIQSRTPARIDPEPALARPAPGRDPEFGEMRTGETKHAASALLLHKDE